MKSPLYQFETERRSLHQFQFYIVCKLTFGFLLFFSILYAAGCHSVKTISQESGEADSSVDYRILIYIHGDGDYLFHDSDGNTLRADEHTLEKAIETAQNAEHGEVFIFHHRAQKKVLGLFPRNTNRVYHYRGGERLNELSYRLVSDQKSFLQTETELFKRYRSDNHDAGLRSFFLYFGHEIPDSPGQGYHLSRPGMEVHTETFVSGIKRFVDGSGRFNMITLSTCNNGTPAMMAQMDGAADVVLASPQNLHLSHIDIRGLSLLEADRNTSSGHLAKAMADDTFQRLTDSMQTAITLSVYNIGEIKSYITELNDQYETYLEGVTPDVFIDNTDCSQLSFFNSQEYTGGVAPLFEPAAFGRHSQKTEHSGWGCKPL